MAIKMILTQDFLPAHQHTLDGLIHQEPLPRMGHADIPERILPSNLAVLDTGLDSIEIYSSDAERQFHDITSRNATISFYSENACSRGLSDDGPHREPPRRTERN